MGKQERALELKSLAGPSNAREIESKEGHAPLLACGLTREWATS